jgi:ABC-type lipoprotein export system ATPase subunit
MEIEEISLIGGFDRHGEREPVPRLDMRMGDVISIVGPTGSGKTALINDIALFADANTPSRRRVLVDGAPAPALFQEDPAHNPIALITQHTTFLSDLPVREFLRIHARIRRAARRESVVEETLAFANELTGEPIIENAGMTELSGGQTRALLVADAVVIGNSPIILLDEIENAGIDRMRALELLKRYRKIFIFVTHDLRITLLSDYRVVLLHGGMRAVVRREQEERRLAHRVGALDAVLTAMRNRLRAGERLQDSDLVAELRRVLDTPATEEESACAS